MTSLAHLSGEIDFNDLQGTCHYKPGAAYSQSKLAQALFARELQRLSDGRGWGLRSMGAHPGFAGTDIFANAQGQKSLLNFVSKRLVIPLIGQSAEAGALPILYAATNPEACGGELYGPTGFLHMKGPPGRCTFAPRALDAELASRLWRSSEALCGVDFS